MKFLLFNLLFTALVAFCLCGAACCAVADVIEAVRGRRGLASWYGENYRGLPMANGQPFNPDAFTCASREYPLGSLLIVISGERSVLVAVTDRGPRRDIYARGVVIDLAEGAFRKLADPRIGLVAVTIREVR